MSIDFPEPYSNWQSHDPVVLFDAPIHKFVPEVRLWFLDHISLSGFKRC